MGRPARTFDSTSSAYTASVGDYRDWTGVLRLNAAKAVSFRSRILTVFAGADGLSTAIRCVMVWIDGRLAAGRNPRRGDADNGNRSCWPRRARPAASIIPACVPPSPGPRYVDRLSRLGPEPRTFPTAAAGASASRILEAPPLRKTNASVWRESRQSATRTARSSPAPRSSSITRRPRRRLSCKDGATPTVDPKTHGRDAVRVHVDLPRERQVCA